MMKILVKSDKNGNRTRVLKPKRGVKVVEVFTALASPVISITLDVTNNDRERALELLASLLDGYAEQNGIELK